MFKNYIIYQLKEPLNLEGVEQKLAGMESKEPSRSVIETLGFIKPLSTSESFVHTVVDSHYFTIRKFKKNIPPKLINYRLNQRLIKAQQNNQTVDKKMRQQLKEEITSELASNTPAIPEIINFVYDEVSQTITINCGSASKAEICLALLRKALNSVPVVPLFKTSIASNLTSWCFEGELPEELEILEKGKLRSHDETKSEAAFNRQFMDAEEVIAAKESGKLVVLMHFLFENDFSFSITDEGHVKSVKYTDFKLETIGDIPKNDEMAHYDAQAALNTETLRSFIEFIKRHINH